MQTSGFISQIAAALGIALAGMVLAQRAGSDAPEPTPPSGLVQARLEPQVQVGQTVDPNALHQITRPGLYGINRSPEGSRYGVLEGRLIRYDPGTMRVQSVIRPSRILD